MNKSLLKYMLFIYCMSFAVAHGASEEESVGNNITFQDILKEEVSAIVTPIKQFFMGYAQEHPIRTAVYGTLAMCLAVYLKSCSAPNQDAAVVHNAPETWVLLHLIQLKILLPNGEGNCAFL